MIANLLALRHTMAAMSQPAGLLGRCARGDREALDEFFRVAGPAVARFVARRVLDPDATADLVQETYARILAGMGRFRGESEPVTWALGIAMNVCREHFRRRARPVAPLRT